MRIAAVIALAICISTSSFAQSKIIAGYIKDSHSEEPIPFASVQLKKSSIGKLSDSAGRFILRVSAEQLDDSLLVTYVGYENYAVALSVPKGDTLFLTISLERGSIKKEVVVKSKKTRGWYLWRRIVQKKPENDRYRFENFGYELYNKLEMDLNRINTDKFTNIRPLRPFGFIIDQTVDSTSEDKPFLPIFLTETISDYYYQKNPLRRREEIKGSRTSGLKNESVQKLLGGMDQNVNVYNNYIPVFDKRFVSPISDNGDAFYNYRLTDTQYIGGKRFFHLVFSPKHKGENTFDGDCWVHDTSFAIQKMNLRLSADANLNFVEKLSVIQEYSLINDSIWFLKKDKFVIDVSPIGKQKFGVTGRKTTTYERVMVNSGKVWESLLKNKQLEETVLLPGATDQTELYWLEQRHDTLSKNEKAIYAMVDTLQKMPLFKKYTNLITFLGTGYKPLGKLEYGPWFNAISSNVVEGLRLRLDLGTSTAFSKKWWLRGYVAYGFAD
ncbi:MAG: carboxypeptidase-like regulatory domain-containing protein, partial [Chitinophagaceae bacterium]|nr:carboxypeptidase-like regulatory domain-containing protein [Chitinophagaceae bacterium]